MKNKILILLSGESGSIPAAEAKALVLAYDSTACFSIPERRLVIADADVDPLKISSRIAFARRVGLLTGGLDEVTELLRGKSVRFRVHRLSDTEPPRHDFGKVISKSGARVDLENPDVEVSIVHGFRTYFAVTRPSAMKQDWFRRRPRARPFFHPSAIFPKLARALVNLTRCREGQILLDPFAGTGSIPLEAYESGLQTIAADVSATMAEGALRNMKAFNQKWLGVFRAEASFIPLTSADSIATDVPYGRAASRHGATPEGVVNTTVELASSLLKRGAFAVIMHSQSVPVRETKDIKLVEEHLIYVHRQLTRAVSVLKRV